MIVRIKSISPDNQEGGTWYGLTLDILEWIPKGTAPGQNRVDSKYLLKVYEILRENRLTECASAETPRQARLSPGTVVRTTRPNMDLRYSWSKVGWELKKWGERGTIIGHHDSHGLYYDVRHDDGTEGPYDPSELELSK